jgi:hypothetical protein
VDALDILFVIVIVENRTNDKDPILVVIIITITGTEITTEIGTEMVALLTDIPIIETVLAVAIIPVLEANLEIIIIEAEIMITITLTKTPLIDPLLLIIEVLIILHKIRLRHPLLLLASGKHYSIIHLSGVPWLLTFMRKPKMPIWFKPLHIRHLSNVMSLFRINPTKLLLIVVLQSA